MPHREARTPGPTGSVAGPDEAAPPRGSRPVREPHGGQLERPTSQPNQVGTGRGRSGKVGSRSSRRPDRHGRARVMCVCFLRTQQCAKFFDANVILGVWLVPASLWCGGGLGVWGLFVCLPAFLVSWVDVCWDCLLPVGGGCLFVWLLPVLGGDCFLRRV